MSATSDNPSTFDTRLAGVAYVESMATLVVRFVSGRMYALPVADLAGADASVVTDVSVCSDGYAAVIRQQSGNRLEVPWDVVLYHADPDYRFYKHGDAVAAAGVDRREIGERIRAERAKRHWTLKDLSVRTGIRIPNLSRLETGRHMPSLDTLEKVAGSMGLPVVALVSARRPVEVAS